MNNSFVKSFETKKPYLIQILLELTLSEVSKDITKVREPAISSTDISPNFFTDGTIHRLTILSTKQFTAFTVHQRNISVNSVFFSQTEKYVIEIDESWGKKSNC